MIKYIAGKPIKTKFGKVKKGASISVVTRYEKTSFLEYEIGGETFYEWINNDKVDQMIDCSKEAKPQKETAKKKSAKKKTAKKK